MGYDVYYSGDVKVAPALTEEHTALVRALVSFEQTEQTQAIFAAIAASAEPDLPGHAGVLDVSDDREYLVPEEGESRHGIRMWLRILLQYVFVPLAYSLDGEISWEGEDRDNCGAIFVQGNQLEAVDDLIFNAGPSWAPNHYADDLLKQAIRDLLDSADHTGCSPGLTVIASERLEAVRSRLPQY